ncbi:MAG: excinuclease ABC subunit UvrC [Lachnospiraceae bacterium]|nr:excinuclease ABC subunit UvrC [Lachnospiraceae bacterium]
MEFIIEEELKKLPHSPGVYLMHDEDDVIIYIGKAVDLFNRVHSYFRKTGKTQKILKMVSNISWFEFILTDSEMEALVLECNLIKEHRPKYNTMLKDDKTYPYIRVTVNEEYPRILVTRSMKKDKSRYFGPYTSALSVKNTVELINRIYGLRTCSRDLPRDRGKVRECLNYHIKKCMGPCRPEFDNKEKYEEAVNGALDLLNGNFERVLKLLKERMQKASDEMRFEDAAVERDLIESVKEVSQKQKITAGDMQDRDVIALYRDEEDAVVQIFFVRNGKLIGRDHFMMTHVQNKKDAGILNEFVKQYYSGTPFVPKEIMIEEEIDEKDLIARYLAEKKGSKVNIIIPIKGSKEKLILLAKKNAQMILENNRERIRKEEGRTLGAAKEMAQILGLEKADRVESYDISHISGFDPVGSMVVFEKGKAKHSDYRKFRIRSGFGNDDYASMHEVLYRRFTHKGSDDEFDAFNRMPDLILMDGGKGQVNAALDVLSGLGISIPVAGLVKDDRHRTRGIYYNNTELPVDRHSEAFALMTRIQDEVHRFAIEYHRSLRKVHQIHSVLDDIKGIGKVRRKELMKHFGSIEDIKKADVEELAAVNGMDAKAAHAVYIYFHGDK